VRRASLFPRRCEVVSTEWAAGYALTGILDDGPGHSILQRWDSLSFVRTGTEGLTWFVPLGLAFIAGQLLLQSPEEDAFWIFISLMDSHLRPYFSSNAIQLNIDVSLFAKAMETIDPTIAKKLFADMAIPPICICRPWSVFPEVVFMVRTCI